MKRIIIKGPGPKDAEWGAASDGFNVNTETLTNWGTQIRQYSIHTTSHWLFLNNQEVTFGIPTGHDNQTIACTPIDWDLIDRALDQYGSVMFGYFQLNSPRPDNVSIINLSRYWARTANGALIDLESGYVLADMNAIFTSWFMVYKVSQDALYCVVNSNLVGIRSDIEGGRVSVINGDTTLRNSLFSPTVDGGIIVGPNIIYSTLKTGSIVIHCGSSNIKATFSDPHRTSEEIMSIKGSDIHLSFNSVGPGILGVLEWRVLTNSDLDVISTPESDLSFKFVIIKS